MAHGIEIVLGFTYHEALKIQGQLGIDLPVDEESYYETEDDLFESLSRFKDALKTTWEAACYDMDWRITHFPTTDLEYYSVQTPKGKREMHPWELEFIFDPDEVDEQITDSTLGVSISSRYSPCFLDWENSHGGVYNFKLDNPMLVIAKRRIVEAIPVFESASWIVRERHY